METVTLILGLSSATWLVFAGFIIGYFSMRTKIESDYEKHLSREMTNFLLEEQEKRLSQSK